MKAFQFISTKKINGFLILGLLFCNIYSVFGQYKIENSLPTPTQAIVAGTALEVKDQQINIPNHWDTDLNATVSLKINNEIASFAWSKTTMGLTIIPILSDGSYDTAHQYTQTLVAEYNPNYNSTNFSDLSVHQILNRYGVKVIINSFSTTNMVSGITTSNVINANVSLELKFETNRTYAITQQIPTLQSTIVNEGSVPVALKFTWPSIVGAKEYELEWTWVDNFGDDNTNINSTLSANQIPFSSRDFELNNTRIKTSKLEYEIPLIYSRGYIIYRLRGVGRFNNDTSGKFYNGPWSTGSSAKVTVADWDTNIVLIGNHDSKKNWQFKASYAEEGKKKEVVSYFDGSLRNRQTVTKTNTENTAIVGEVIYDVQGRAAIEVLPVPLIGKNYIRYFSDLNKNTSNLSYTYRDFDLNSSSSFCTTPLSGMSNSSGASNYYSPNNVGLSTNPILNNVPDALNYPFSQVVYTPDNTGRIQSKGGVGPVHQIDKLDDNDETHEMKYFYTVPEQPELNRLFGYSVGDASHYKKNIVVDPNGQISVSYIDPKGKTIATALTGGSPTSLKPLVSPLSNLSTDLLKKLTEEATDTDADNNILETTNNFNSYDDRLSLTKQIGVTGKNVPYTFIYKVKNENVFTPSGSTFLPQACALDKYAFVYDLDINLKNDCLTSIIDIKKSTDHPSTIGTESYGSNPGTLSETNIPIPDPVGLHVGTYGLSKNLTVNKKALEDYADRYIAQITDHTSTCYIDPSHFNPYATLPVDCNTTCEECDATIGLQNDYILKEIKKYYGIPDSNTGIHFTGSQVIVTSGTLSSLNVSIIQAEVTALQVRYAKEWELLHQICEQICGKEVYFATSSCQIGEESLLKDVSPAGQYGKITFSDAALAAANATTPVALPEGQLTDDELSVFNENNKLYYNGTITNHNWRYPDPLKPYADESGVPSKIVVQLDGTYTNGAVKYSPEILNSVTPASSFAANGESILTVIPQQLKFVTDFKLNWKISWANSLVNYHPEHNYEVYLKEVCNLNKDLTPVVITKSNSVPPVITYANGAAPKSFSSDDYDNYLDYLDYGAAVQAGLFNLTSTTGTSILNNDPYFNPNTPLPSTIQSTTVSGLGKNIMVEAINTKYENFATGTNLFKAAYQITMGNAIVPFVDNGNYSSLNADQKNRLWNTYKSLYKSLKSRIKQVLLNLYANNLGTYNGCIGTPPQGTFVSVISNYTNAATIAGLFSTPANSVCSSGVNYTNKVKRFMPVDAIYNSASTDLTDAIANSHYQYYLHTGNCPMVQDLEVFLSGYFQEYSATVGFGSKPIGQYMSKKLFDIISNNAVITSGQNVNIVPSVQSGNKTIIFSLDTPTTCAEKIHLNIPSTSTYNWSNYNVNPTSTNGKWNIVLFKDLFYDRNASDLPNHKFAFSVLAKVYNGIKFEEVVMTGTTCAPIGECSTSSGAIGEVLDPNSATIYDTEGCNRKAKFVQAFVNFFNTVKGTTTSSVVLAGVTTYSQTFLAEFFNESTTINSNWVKNPTTNTFDIVNGTQILFSIQNNFGSGTIPLIQSVSINTNASPNTITFNYASGSTTCNIIKNLNFSCCHGDDTFVPNFTLRQQISQSSSHGGKLYTRDITYTPKDISFRKGDVINMEIGINSTHPWSTDPLDYNVSLKMNGLGYDVHGGTMKYEFTESVSNELNRHPAKDRISWNGNYPATFEMNKLYYYINASTPRLFNFNEGTGNTASAGSLSMNLSPAGSWLTGQNGLAFSTVNESSWSDSHPFTFLPEEIGSFTTFISTTIKFTDNLTFVGATRPNGPQYYGHILQLDNDEGVAYNVPNSNLFEILVFATEPTDNDCLPCIPQPVVPISCTDKYLQYKTYFNFIPSIPTEDNPVSVPTSTVVAGLELGYTEDQFCDLKLGYLVDSYIAYLQAFDVEDVTEPKYLSITQFGNTGLHYGYNGIADVITAYSTYCSETSDEDEVDWNQYVDTIYLVKNNICGLPAAMQVNTPTISLPTESVCEKIIKNITALYQQEAYNAYIASLRENFIREYIKAAMENVVEKFTMSFDDQEYQYTLYYYDQAGNLTQTVAPEGVNRLDASLNNQINAYRDASNPLTDPVDDSSLQPVDKFKTHYAYNSLNQLVSQSTPDGGTTNFAYDKLGRIIASQNDQQRADQLFGGPARMSYTLYDPLGRITEAGQLVSTRNIGSYPLINFSISNEGKLIKSTNQGGRGSVITYETVDGFPNNLAKTEVTRTIYDDYPLVETNTSASTLFITPTTQNNSRNRVTAVFYHENFDPSDLLQFDNAIFYNYDIHGNVKEVDSYYTPLRDLDCGSVVINTTTGQLNDCEAHIKRVVYDYDLISGNVNKVTYQPSTAEKPKKDQFIHVYNYDADNRVINVQTSKDGVVWEEDADYKYYPHGPLARVQLGNKKIQGIDYAYTLQGWLKTVNGENLSASANDLGQDGSSTGTTKTKDAYGYSLNYYDGDYKAIANDTGDASFKPLMYSRNNTIPGNINNLYNGNIKQMTTAIRTQGENLLTVQKNNYQYDQLNRIAGMTSSAINPLTSTFTDSYESSYTYDKNGNIQTLRRTAPKANGTVVEMDNLSYDYQSDNNKLALVKDNTTTPSATFNNDLENQVAQLASINITYDITNKATHNYIYDKIGQLIEDKTEGLVISWRVDGKVKSVSKSLPNDIESKLITFDYDGLGNRIAKKVETTSALDGSTLNKTTFYAHDAQGNTLATYDYDVSTDGNDNTNKTLTLKEHEIYGSSRLGLESEDLLVYKNAPLLVLEDGKKEDLSSSLNPSVDTNSLTTGDYSIHYDENLTLNLSTIESGGNAANGFSLFELNTKLKIQQTASTAFVGKFVGSFAIHHSHAADTYKYCFATMTTAKSGSNYTLIFKVYRQSAANSSSFKLDTYTTPAISASIIESAGNDVNFSFNGSTTTPSASVTVNTTTYNSSNGLTAQASTITFSPGNIGTSQLGGTYDVFTPTINSAVVDMCGLDFSFSESLSGGLTDTVTTSFPLSEGTDYPYDTNQNPMWSNEELPSNFWQNACAPFTDSDHDGIADANENINGNASLTDDDSDNDGIPNYLDPDDDNDGVLTKFERNNSLTIDGTTTAYNSLNTDADSSYNYLDNDDDNDGVLTKYEIGLGDLDGNPATGNGSTEIVLDTDNDTVLNYLDTDDDADGIATQFEGATPNGIGAQDLDNDLKPNYLDEDDDGDGIFTKFEGVNADGDFNPNTGTTLNTDADASPNYLDVDDDNDNYATWEVLEGGPGSVNSSTSGIAYTLDSDTDGTPNYLDNTDGNYPVNGPIVLNYFSSLIGDKRYELSNHLGNVLVVINDKKLPEFNTANLPSSGLKYFNVDVLSYNDYYPFGSLVPNRHSSSTAYRYGFNGKEKDDEIKGEGDSYDYGARMYDSRIGRWFSPDPLEKDGPEYSPYNYTFNCPINLTDPDGRWPDLPSWNSIKKSTNAYLVRMYYKTKSDWENIKHEVYNGKGWDDVVKDTKTHIKETKKWFKENKGPLLAGAKFLKKTGDRLTTSGLSGAAIGAVATAPVGGEGAAPGLAVATFGEGVSTAGTSLEIIVKVITGDEEAKGDIITFVASKTVSKAVDIALPGPTPDTSEGVKKLIETGNKIIENGVDKKVEEASEKIKEKIKE